MNRINLIIISIVCKIPLLYSQERYLIKISTFNKFELQQLYSQALKGKFNLRFQHNSYIILTAIEKELHSIPVEFEIIDIADESAEYFLVLVHSEDALKTLRSVCPEIVYFDGQTAIVRSTYNRIQEITNTFKIKRLPEKIYQPEAYVQFYSQYYSVFAIEEDQKTIEKFLSQITTAAIYNYILELQNFQTRYTYSENCNEVMNYLVKKIKEFGLQVSTYAYIIGDKIRYNVIAEIKGETSPEKIYILSAHYDSTSNMPMSSAPGADDNASGCAALLSIMEIIKNQKFHSTIRFAFFSGEEQGLVGSGNYAEYLFNNAEKVIAVFNLDMIGYWKTTLPRDLDLITNVKSKWLASFLAQCADKYSSMSIKQTVDDGAWWSDHSSFWDYGFYAVDLSEAYNWYSTDFNPYYHTTEETVDKLDMAFAVDITKIAFAVTAQLANPLSLTEELVILEPDGLNDKITQGEKYKIEWINNTGSGVRIFYDNDIDGEGGTEIAQLGPAFNSYIWDTSNIAPGKYYVYLSTSQGYYKVSSGPLTILSALPQVRVYPNPFYPSKGHTRIVFSNLMANTEIRIYNIAGEIVKEQFVSDESEWGWNVRNTFNEDIASGIYFFTATNKDNKTSYGKFAVIR